MKLRLGDLRRVICEVAADCWGGSRPEETYDEELEEDDAYKKKSVLVPDDVKHSINKYFKAMGLSGTKKKRSA
jgi:hypothetical protein